MGPWGPISRGVGYRDYTPSGALRGSVSALFSFCEPIEEPTNRPVSLEVGFGSKERVWAPTFADPHACIIFSFARHYCPDGVWRSCSEPSTSNVNGGQ
jgi:hypothetical protein